MSTNNPAAQINGKKKLITVCLKFQPRLSYRLSPKEEQMYCFPRSSEAFNCCNNNNYNNNDNNNNNINNNDDDDDDNNDNDNDNNNNNK